MRTIKLLTLTSWNYVIIFAVLTLFFFGIFFYIIEQEVFHSIDEVLYNRKVRILDQIKRSGDKVPDAAFQFTDFRLIPATSTEKQNDVYADTIIFEPADNEWDEFRKLTVTTDIGGTPYLLEIVAPRMETPDIVKSITKSLILVFIVMIGVFFFTSRFFSRRLWQPFYTTLNKLNKFEIDQSGEIELQNDRIEEFGTLNKSITDLTQRAKKTFDNQKQFIENASHEMQTPLAITQTKLELLIDDPNLTEEQSEIIQTLINSTHRMTRLNKTLLLLSKIDNEQFFEKEEVEIYSLIEEILTVFEDQRESQEITLQLSIDKTATISCNRVLVDLLITNLIKNALVHNVKNGLLSIDLKDKQLTVSNTSNGPAIPAEKLFQRFYKNSSRKDSWGLGLAIVNKICSINHWTISYSKSDNIHSFVVTFR